MKVFIPYIFHSINEKEKIKTRLTTVQRFIQQMKHQ